MDLEARAIRRVSRRLLPLLIVCYFISYLDRVNVGFAALTMNKDLGISATAYGLGAGIFFLTYFAFEVPSNLFLERVGARVWIARIMLTWGLLSGAMAFIVGETSFYAVRLLLGAAEAGFFPGIIFYLTLWFPARYRGRIISSFMIAIPLSSVIGSPLSGALLGLDGVLGFKGWQWLYVLEALPAVLLAASCWHSSPTGRSRPRGSRRTSAHGWCSASRTSGGRGNRPAATACAKPSPTGACSRSPSSISATWRCSTGSASSCRRS